MTATPEDIIKIVSETLGVAIEDMLGSSRRREISSARQIAMYLMRQYTDLSYRELEKSSAVKDHTTVMYSCEKITQLKQKNLELSQKLRQLSDRIHIASGRVQK